MWYICISLALFQFIYYEVLVFRNCLCLFSILLPDLSFKFFFASCPCFVKPFCSLSWRFTYILFVLLLYLLWYDPLRREAVGSCLLFTFIYTKFCHTILGLLRLFMKPCMDGFILFWWWLGNISEFCCPGACFVYSWLESALLGFNMISELFKLCFELAFTSSFLVESVE